MAITICMGVFWVKHSLICVDNPVIFDGYTLEWLWDGYCQCKACATSIPGWYRIATVENHG